VTTTYIWLRGTAESDELPGQPTHATPTAPAANASTRITLCIKTSRATSHSPPHSHATRPAPDGTSPASASTALAQSRRAAGSSPTEHRRSPASTRVNRSITPPSRHLTPARPARAARCFGRGRARRLATTS
jgi:hypothetical protein